MRDATLYVLSDIFWEVVRMMKNTIKFKEVDADTLKNINGGGVGDFIQGMIFEIIYSAKQKRR